jgi:hypothetical protein
MAGRPKIFETPEEVLEYFEEYKEDVLENPIKVVDYVGKDAKEITRKHYRPLTWSGFEAFLFRKYRLLKDMDQYRYNQDGLYSEYMGIIRAIGREMYDNKFSGAAVGIYQQNIIARELGLADTQKVHNFDRPILEKGEALPEDFDGVTDDDLLG